MSAQGESQGQGAGVRRSPFSYRNLCVAFNAFATNPGPMGDETGTRNKERKISTSHRFNHPADQDDPESETSLAEEQMASQLSVAWPQPSQSPLPHTPSQGLTAIGTFRFQIQSYSPLETQIIETTQGNKMSQSQQGQSPLDPGNGQNNKQQGVT